MGDQGFKGTGPGTALFNTVNFDIIGIILIVVKGRQLQLQIAQLFFGWNKGVSVISKDELSNYKSPLKRSQKAYTKLLVNKKHTVANLGYFFGYLGAILS